MAGAPCGAPAACTSPTRASFPPASASTRKCRSWPLPRAPRADYWHPSETQGGENMERTIGASWSVTLALLATVATAAATRADETCMSPYMPKVTGQEDYVYVWTVGVEGLGDGSDKLVAIGANPARPDYGKVISSVSVGGRHEAHHGGFSDDRRYLWAGGLDDSMIWVFDLAPDPGHPKVVKTIDTFVADSGGV